MTESNEVHASLGGSSAHRWTRCARSPRVIMERKKRDGEKTSSNEAKEGTLAHALARFCLDTGHDASFAAKHGLTFNVGSKGESDHRTPDIDMINYVQGYVDRCRAFGGKTFVEHRVSFDPWVKGNFGTLDFATYIKKERLLVVRDLKYGQGEQVNAHQNEGLLIYAIGLMTEIEDLYEVDNVLLEIDQPRAGGVSSYSLPFSQPNGNVKSLKEWALWFNEKYLATLDPNAPFTPGEKQCRWCDYKDEPCPALEKMTLDLADEIKGLDSDSLSTERLTKILEVSDVVRKFLGACYYRALSLKQNGVDVPGYKIVEGRTNRAWINNDTVLSLLEEEGFSTADVCSFSLKSPSQIQNLLGKNKFKEFECYVTKPPGKQTLVSSKDYREEIVSDYEV